MIRAASRRALLLAAGALLPGAVRAADDPNPDASIEIEEIRVGILFLGGSIGGGRLRYRGREHPFSVTGLSAGSIGVSSLRASGEVFGLGRLGNFSGIYSEFQATGVAGDSGLQVRWLRNGNGVRLRLRSLRSGVMLEISATGVTFNLEER